MVGAACLGYLAPGFLLELGSALCVFLPGVPGEMKAMFDGAVTDLIDDRWSLEPPLTATLRVAALGESVLQERLRGFDAGDPRISLGFRTHMYENHLKLQAPGARSDEALRERFEAARTALRELLGIDCYGEGDTGLPEVVCGLLHQRGETVTTAESCTGGLVAQLLTSASGSSDVFQRGFVTYANEAKREMLGVPAELLVRHGAVSEPVACSMAEGARATARADWAVALTGIAGPTGGTPDKPVGLVYVALAGAAGTRVRKLHLFEDRALNRRLSAQAGLEMLRRDLIRAPR